MKRSIVARGGVGALRCVVLLGAFLVCGARAQDPGEASWLFDPIRERVAHDDPDGARELLGELLGEGLEPLLEGLEVEPAEAFLGELQQLCRDLFERDLRVTVLETLHERRSARCAPHDALLRDVKSQLAVAHWEAGDFEGALALEEEVYEVLEGLLEPDDPESLTRAKGNLASTLHSMGRLERALELKREVHDTFARTLSADHMDLLFAKGNLAVTLADLGDLAGALELEQEVHDGFERLLPENHPNLLYAKSNLATSRAAFGDLAGAFELDREVVAARRAFQPPDHPDLLASLGNMGLRLRALGDLEGALALFEETYLGLRIVLTDEHPFTLSAKLNLAGTRGRLGDHEGALALYEQIYAVHSRKLPPDHPRMLEVMQGLALARGEFGDLEGELALEEQLYATRVATLSPEHPDRIRTALNLASTLYALGQNERSAELVQDAVGALEGSLPADNPYLLYAKANQISTLAMAGETEAALALAEEVMAVLEGYPANHEARLATRLSLAVVRAQVGDAEGARAAVSALHDDLAVALDQAFTSPPREARARVLDAVGQLAKSRFVRDLEGEGYIHLDESSFELLETARHVVSQPLNARLSSTAGPELSEARARLTRIERELDGLVAVGPEPEGGVQAASGWRASLQEVSARRENAQRDLLALLGGGENPATRVRAPDVAARLPARHVAVGFHELSSWTWDTDLDMPVDGGSHLFAAVLVPDAPVAWVDLGPVGAIEELVTGWRAAIGKPVEGRGVGVGVEASGASEADSGRALRAALLDPLLAAAGEPARGATLHVCLDGFLHLIPLDALPLAQDAAPPGEPDADIARLGDRYAVQVEISFARLLSPPAPSRAAPSLLAVGNVDFLAPPEGASRGSNAETVQALAASVDGLRDSRWASWDPLPGTEAEIEALRGTAEQHLEVRARLLQGREVTEAALAEAVRGVRTVHLATHGWFMPGSVRSMVERESLSGQPDLIGSRQTVTGWVPMALCGLVLSGANAAEGPVELASRLLTAMELAELDLGECDLAVLSACETHVGATRAGQGIQSLQTGLHAAGARSSITSLWSVGDWSTQSLMANFYERLWGDGLSKADALWSAKCALRAQGRPPVDWAGWVLSGQAD